MIDLFDNIVWHALTGPHAAHAVGAGAVRRYARGFSPVTAFADPRCPDLATLAAHCDAGESLYCDGWDGPPPPGWRVEAEKTMWKMVWQGAAPAADEAADAIRLAAPHAQQAVDLAMLTRPGPFGLRTIELGEYYGLFEGERLVAMAGERFRAGPLREISGVCTHPDAQGRGHARRLMRKLIRRQMARGETPVLHVMSDNDGAHRLYQRMGFVDHRLSVVRVIARS